MWHRRLGHISPTLLNKLVSKELVRRLPKINFSNIKLCAACAKGKQLKSSFKSKNEFTTSRPIELIYTNLYSLVEVARNISWWLFITIQDTPG